MNDGRPATLATGPGLVRFDQLNQRFPVHSLNLIHETLRLGAFRGRALLEITVGEAFRATVADWLLHMSFGHPFARRKIVAWIGRVFWILLSGCIVAKTANRPKDSQTP